MPNTKDVRFIRTEQAIRSAFMALVAEEPVEAITATAVCRRADISRNAFYLHHASVAELYGAMVDELLADVRAVCVASAKRVSASRDFDEELVPAGVAVLEKHKGLLRALLPADDGSLAKRLAEGLEEAYVESALVFGPHGASLEHRLRCAFTAWAVLGLVQRWLESTDLPFSDLMPYLADFERGVQAGATRFLAGANTNGQKG